MGDTDEEISGGKFGESRNKIQEDSEHKRMRGRDQEGGIPEGLLRNFRG